MELEFGDRPAGAREARSGWRGSEDGLAGAVPGRGMPPLEMSGLKVGMLTPTVTKSVSSRPLLRGKGVPAIDRGRACDERHEPVQGHVAPEVLHDAGRGSGTH